MGTRIKLGIFYSYDENWIGGSYYIQNLILSLNLLEDNRKPELIIFSNSEENYIYLSSLTNYPYLSSGIQKFTKNIFIRIINKISVKVFSTDLLNLGKKKPDYFFPINHPSINFEFNKNLFWIPDLQEKYLPHFFSKEEINTRNEFHKHIAYKENYVLFSSLDALNSFNHFYSNSNSKKFVVPFAVHHPSFKEIDIDDLRLKYELPNQYFFSPNQFWVHKNHIVLLKALKFLKDKGIYINIVFSGKEFDFRNKDYTNSLKQYVIENELQNQVFFLGFIDRKEQLKIMENSLAVIQPSKFEGWSSVIEDCKLIGKYLFASSLPVHLEQIKNNVEFFDADNFEELSQKLDHYIINPIGVSKINYIENQVKFGEKFCEMLESIKLSY